MINSKRADFCISNKKHDPIAVIEYYGSGHFNESAEKRDEIKELACEKAGIKYIVIRESDLGSLENFIREKVIPLLEGKIIKTVSFERGEDLKWAPPGYRGNRGGKL